LPPVFHVPMLHFSLLARFHKVDYFTILLLFQMNWNFKSERFNLVVLPCTTLRTSWNWSVAFLLVSNRNNDTKYGSIANKSIIFSPPLKNFHLSGDALKRNMYSNVNHVIQTASTIARSGLSPAATPLWLWSFGWKDGMVFNVKAIVDRTMKRIDITAITCNWKSFKQKETVRHWVVDWNMRYRHWIHYDDLIHYL